MRKALVPLVIALAFSGCQETTIHEGRWRVTRLRAVLPDSGARPQELVRTGRGRVARFVSLVRVYPQHDCVIYVGKTDRPMWFAVCGDGQPMPLVPYSSDNDWYSDDGGLSRWLRLETDGKMTRVAIDRYGVADLSRGRTNVTTGFMQVDGSDRNPASREPAWSYAIRSHDCAAVRAMSGIPLGEVPPYDTPLITAVLNGDLCIAKELLKRGADPNQRSSRGETALTEAVNDRNAEMVALLISSGATPESIRMARERARQLRQPEIIQLLERDSADGRRR